MFQSKVEKLQGKFLKRENPRLKCEKLRMSISSISPKRDNFEGMGNISITDQYISDFQKPKFSP